MNDVTHLGLQDIPMLGNIPNLVYLAPVTKEDYLAMLDWSMEQREHPVAIKLPGGKLISDGKTGSRGTQGAGKEARSEGIDRPEKEVQVNKTGTETSKREERRKTNQRKEKIHM